MKLHTRFSITECRARLEAAVDAEKLGFSLSGYAGSREIIGKIQATSFRLQKTALLSEFICAILLRQFHPFGC
jgi:hypothetical protein